MSANSVYGFTGAQVGKLPCLPISQVMFIEQLEIKSSWWFKYLVVLLGQTEKELWGGGGDTLMLNLPSHPGGIAILLGHAEQ